MTYQGSWGHQGARFYNPYHPPVSLVDRFRLGGQILLDIENLSLALRWAETISTTKALVRQRSIKCRVESCRKQMLLGNVTRITWITAMTQSGSRIGGQVQTGWADLALYE